MVYKNQIDQHHLSIGIHFKLLQLGEESLIDLKSTVGGAIELWQVRW